MIISFDLDDTLIPTTKKFDVEKQIFSQKVFKIEKLRLGTKELFENLRKNNHKIYIYTTSFRSQLRIFIMFKSYGLKVDKIINQNVHLKRVRKNATKYPPEFEIDLHIDDSIGVQMEGEKYNFKTIIILPEDKNWVEKLNFS